MGYWDIYVTAVAAFLQRLSDAFWIYPVVISPYRNDQSCNIILRKHFYFNIICIEQLFGICLSVCRSVDQNDN